MANSQDKSGKSGEASFILPEKIKDVRAFAEAQILRVHNLIKIGTALSAEKDHERLLGMIVDEAKRYTNADGCTLYIKDLEKETLNFKVVRNDSLNIRMGGTGNEITWPPVPLLDEDGQENHRNVSAYCALTGEAINIQDVYNADFDFQGTKTFDETTGYRSKSMLVVPMRDHEDEIIGVIQLLNALDGETGQVIDFPESEIEIVTSLASQAAIAITNMSLIQGLEELLHSIIKMIAAAIDEKSPYTSGHVERVAELTDQLASAINEDSSKEFAEIFFSKRAREELRMAAWMHDVGKITTPEYVVDKATKLETIFDRIELVQYRIEILKRDAEISRLKSELAGSKERKCRSTAVVEEKITDFQEYKSFLEAVNVGGEFLSDENLEKVKKLAKLELDIDGVKQSLLTDDELANLSIRKGTLNKDEREIINNHARLTIKMLDSLPFPRKMKNIPVFAGMHHEKLDGSGYPAGLKGENIPLQARIMAVADIFEALTAADRPYTPGKMLSEAMRIIKFMVQDNHLDGAICDLMVESGMVASYAKRYLAERQHDDFEWRGKIYSVKDF